MTEPSAPEAVAAGHLCLDLIPDLAGVTVTEPGRFFVPGALLSIGPATIGTGGPVSNAGLALTRLGVRTALMGKVGDDPFGHLLRRVLAERWGIEQGLIVEAGATTSYSVVLSPGRLDRMFLHCPGANDTFGPDDIDYELVGQARLFHFGYPPIMRRMYADGGVELAEILRRVRAAGVTTSLDMTMPDPASPGGRADWRAILERALPHVDLYLPSADETLYMLDRARFDRYRAQAATDLTDRFTGDDLHNLSEPLLAMGAGAVGIKVGHRGFYLRTGSAERLAQAGRAGPVSDDPADPWARRELWHPTLHAERFVSATGSGDSTIAGFLSAVLRGLGPRSAMRSAVGTGSCNVQAPDSLSGLPDWADLQARLAAGWLADPLTVEGTGWRRAAVEPFWAGPADAVE